MDETPSGIIRFIANVEEGVILELDHEGASASLAARFHAQFECDPDYERTAVAGLTFDLGDDQRGVCVSRSPSVAATNEAIRLITLKYGIVKRLNRPPYRARDEHHVVSLDWTFDLDRARYDQTLVSSWPETSTRPVRDLVVIEYLDQVVFVATARRNGEHHPPSPTVAGALTFSCWESAQAWIEKHAAAQRDDLVMRYRSVALSITDQARAEASQGLRG